MGYDPESSIHNEKVRSMLMAQKVKLKEKVRLIEAREKVKS